MKYLLYDLRYGARMLTRSPAFTAIALLTLALGIGANTAIFSVVNSVLLNPFPYSDHSRLMLIRQSLPKIGIDVQTRSSGPEYFEYKEQDGIFEQVAAWEPVSRNLTGGLEPERVAAAKVTGDLFDMLGIAPVLGRTINNGDQGPKAEPVLVLSYALWQSRFGGEASILGQKVALDDDPYTVIGVMPPNFRFDGGSSWFAFPMELDKLDRKYRQFAVIARLKQGISIDQAQAELDVAARRLEQDFAGVNPEYEGRGITVTPYRDWVLGTMQPALIVLIYAVTAILLIACVNIANLLLVRAVKREKEIAIRTRTVSTGYFRTLGVRLLQGEEFSPQDRGNTPPVIIVNRTLAEKYWPDQEAVGKRIMIVRPNRPGVSLTVKGVVEDSAQMSLDIPVNPEIYFTLEQNAGAYRRMNLAVRTGANPHSLTGGIVREIQSIDKDQPVYQVQTLQELIGITIATRRLVMFLLALFSGIAMLLAAVGIYGVMTYNVSQRTHEIGIRMALGANRRDVLRLIAQRGMLLVGAGVVTGLIGAFAATRLLASLLFEVTATDPMTFVAVTAFLVAVAMAASYIPARRATRLDPIAALRYE